MTAPIGITFALATAVITGGDTSVMGLVAAGSLLPEGLRLPLFPEMAA